MDYNDFTKCFLAFLNKTMKKSKQQKNQKTQYQYENVGPPMEHVLSG